MTSIHSQIVENSNQATALQSSSSNLANSTSSSSSSSTVSSYDFLKLLTEQLQYQDPTNPTDNSEMLAQEAQFSTLEQMENLSSSFSSFSNIYQANSLLGQNVEVTVDDKTTSGVVDYVDFSDSSGAALSINGNSYPLSSVTKVYPKNSNSTTDTTAQNENLGEKISNISENISNIASKLSNYLTNNQN